MFELLTTLTLFGSFISFCIALGIYVILLFLSEYEKNGYLALTFTISLGILFYFGNTPISQFLTWINIGVYLGIGFIYSLIKTFIFARKEQRRYLDHSIKRQNYVQHKNGHYVSETYDKKLVKDHIFRWWFLWPISFMSWMFTDLVKDLFNGIYSIMSGFYNYLVEIAEKTVKIKDNE